MRTGGVGTGEASRPCARSRQTNPRLTRMSRIPACCLLAVLCSSPAIAATHWNWEWTPAPDETAPSAEICALKYGKTWAYTVEIDDGPASTMAAAALLSGFHYTDAPPGVPGGSPRPFVGSAAVFTKRIAGNTAYVDFDALRALQAAGWGVANHSYAHTGSAAAPLTPAQIREDHYWSQTVFAAELGRGRASSHFVYANGWIGYAGPTAGDYSYFAEFGFRGGTRAGGTSPRNLLAPNCDVRNFKRSNLDGLNTADPLRDFAAPTPGDFIVELTHSLDPVEGSENRNAWTARLTHLAATYGAGGDDSVWSAPSAVVFDHVAAARVATVAIVPGRVCLTLPDTAPGAALTVKLTGIPPASVIAAPPGGLVHRDGNTVWLTTPFLGQPGSPAPFPRVERIYRSFVQDLFFAPAGRIAGIQIHQQGTAPDPLVIDLSTETGPRNFATATGLGSNWGDRKLFAAVPTLGLTDLPRTTAIRITTNNALKELSVWIIDESVRRWPEWQAIHFSPDEIAAGTADDLADPDADGLANLVEYGLSSDPRVSSPTAGPTLSTEDGFLVLSFTRTTAHPDAVLSVEASTDLADPTCWTLIAQSASGAAMINNGATAITESDTGSSKTVQVRDALPLASGPRRFLRLRVTPL